jgi:hypothetical protein
MAECKLNYSNSAEGKRVQKNHCHLRLYRIKVHTVVTNLDDQKQLNMRSLQVRFESDNVTQKCNLRLILTLWSEAIFPRPEITEQNETFEA